MLKDEIEKEINLKYDKKIIRVNTTNSQNSLSGS
jgi:hypothetical protein